MTLPIFRLAPFMQGKRVAIVGGGPAGLTLARLLQMRGLPVDVYERDASPATRNQGGSLDLHERTGQRALREAGLAHRFHDVARRDGQYSKVFDKHGTQLATLRAEDEAETRPEIDRGALRDLLVEALAPGTVHWGRHLVRVVASQAQNGEHWLEFSDGERVSADLVIGCDGSNSKVRELLSPLKPYYGGVTFVETRVSAARSRYPELARLVGAGNVLALGDNKGLMAQHNGDGDIRIYVALRVPEAWSEQSGIDFASPVPAREQLLRMFADWSPEMVQMLRLSDDIFIPRPLYTFDPDQSWTTRAGITVIGDAAHVMPPFSGQGANLAMLDAVELVECLAGGESGTLNEALHAFEHKMLSGMAIAIRDTLASQDMIIAPDAPAGLVALLKSPASSG